MKRIGTAYATRMLPLLLLLLPGGCATPSTRARISAQYNYTETNNTITITKYIGSDIALTIPSIIDGLPVTSIGWTAFENSDLTWVKIPASVTSIDPCAFSSFCPTQFNTAAGGSPAIGSCAPCDSSQLRQILVDASNPVYSSLNGVLFDKHKTMLIRCPPGKMGSYIIPAGVITIGEGAFSGCHGLTNITITHTVKGIGDGAFSLCDNLVGITVPTSVTRIGSGAFERCNKLANFIVPTSVSNIEALTFALCGSLTNVIIPDGVIEIGGGAFQSCHSLTSITIPSSVSEIGPEAFDSCTGLTNVTIPRGVIIIHSGTFAGCTSLTNITIPDTVAEIWDAAFRNCTGLRGVYFQGHAPSLGWSRSAFDNCSNATIYCLPGRTGWSETFGGRPAVGWTPSEIHVAAKAGDEAKVKALLTAEPELANCRDEKGYPPLFIAANKEVAELLIAHKADMGGVAKLDNQTPLHSAASRGNREVVEVLINHKADLNAKTRLGAATPLKCAIGSGRMDIVELLLDHGVDVNATNVPGLTPLADASLRGKKEIVEVLLARKAEVNPKGWRSSPLFWAAKGGNRDVVKLLLDHGAEVNTNTNSGLSPFFEAVGKANRDVVELLIAYNVNVNAKGNSGWTALHTAAGCDTGKDGSCIEVAKVLLLHGADVNSKLLGGETPLDLAKRAGNKEMIELLEKHGGK